MRWELFLWLGVGVFGVLVAARPSWAYPGAARVCRLMGGPVPWCLIGFPTTAVRMCLTWRRLCVETGLAVTKRSRSAVLGGDLLVSGSELRPKIPRLGVPRRRPGAYGCG